jgi:hypothetical protein
VVGNGVGVVFLVSSPEVISDGKGRLEPPPLPPERVESAAAPETGVAVAWVVN